MNPVLIAQIKKPATYVTGFVARMREISNSIIDDMKMLTY
jgi:hypothetical protein